MPMQKKQKISICILIITLFMFLIGCKATPEDVLSDRNYSYVPISDLEESPNFINEQPSEDLAINANVFVPNQNSLNRYKVKPMQYDLQRLSALLGKGINDFNIIQQNAIEVDNVMYETMCCISSDGVYNIYYSNLSGRFVVSSILDDSDISRIKRNEIDSSLSTCNVSIDEIMENVTNLLNSIGVESQIESISAYRYKNKDYYCLRFFQTINGVPLNIEGLYFSRANNAISDGNFINVIYGDEGLIQLEAQLLETADELSSINYVISLNDTIRLIEKNRNILGLEFAEKMPITRIMLIYLVNNSELQAAWWFSSGVNRDTNKFISIKIDAITGQVLS